VNSLAAGVAGNVIFASGIATWASGTPDATGLVDKSSAQVISGAKAFTNYVQLSSQNELRLADADSTNYISLRSPATIGSNVTLTFPSNAGAGGQFLSTDGSGGLSWSSISGTISGLNAGRVALSASANSVADSANLTFNSSTGALAIGGSAPNIVVGAANSVTVNGVASGATPSIFATGVDANIDLLLGGKGTGVLKLEDSVAERAPAAVNSSTSYVIPDSSLAVRRITMTANTTITLPAFSPAGNPYAFSLTVVVTQDASGGRTLAWAANGADVIRWDSSASAPAPATAANKETIYQFVKFSDSSIWYGSMVWKEN
jgi:hypothetical protein